MGVYEKATKMAKVIDADQVSPQERAFLGTLIGMTIMGDMIEAGSDEGTDQSRAQFAADVDRVMNEIYVPLDLPIPNYIEPFADMGAVQAMRSFVLWYFGKASAWRARVAEIAKAKAA